MLSGDFDHAAGGSAYQFARDFRRAISPTSARNRQKTRNASSRWWPPAATAQPARSRRRCLEKIGCEVIPLDTRARPHLPETTIRTRKTREMLHAIRDAVLRARAPMSSARLRRRRRPLRRGRRPRRGDLRRQGQRHAGARHVGDPPGRAVRGRREIDRTVHRPIQSSRSKEAKTDYWKTSHSYIEAPRTASSARSPALRNPATSSSTSRSAAAMTTAWSRRSRSTRCSTAPAELRR